MPSWTQLADEFNALPAGPARIRWFQARQVEYIKATSTRREGRNILVYASAFLQKPDCPFHYQAITSEDLNGLMSCLHGMDCKKGLTLVLHTPGGSPNAAQTLVGYLRSKFDYIEVIIPAYAMSAGTMISLACDLIIMGRQSQMGPIDPIINNGPKAHYAGAIVAQFAEAANHIRDDPKNAHVWASILAPLGPSLYQEAKHALEYGRETVQKWLAEYMLKGDSERGKKAARIAKHFNDTGAHKSHGRRIDRTEAREQGLNVIDLEEDQHLQEAVLSLYHLITLLITVDAVTKIMITDSGKVWSKSIVRQQ